MKRRDFLQLQALWGLSGSVACDGEPERTLSSELWISSAGASEADYGIVFATPEGAIEYIKTGSRGHEVLGHPLRPGRLIFVGRRPSRQMMEIDLIERRICRVVDCEAEHHLMGHACFSSDGSVLFSAESNYEQGEGRIVVRDALDYRVLDVFESHGIGPHQLRLMPGGNELVVANGGLLTHPDSGRSVLNLESMRSTLSFVQTDNGSLSDEYSLDEPKASIRHLDVSAEGRVAVGAQMQREAAGHEVVAPLAAVYESGRGLEVLTAPEELVRGMNDYVGSVCVNESAEVAAFSSPRGDLVLFWQLITGEYLGFHRFVDVSGLTNSVDGSRIVLSSSSGQLRAIDAQSLAPQQLPPLSIPDVAWDNHLSALSSM